ncbi:MAG: hypothetical protein QOF36_1541 [Microbacteriaceae bacterium]|nr:hypothetical protein [Microbacteriaceae bacterium]
MIPYLFQLTNIVGPIVYWAAAVLLVMVSLCCAAFALRFPRRPLVYISGGTLAGALAVLSIPGPSAPPLVHVLLGIASLALAIVGGGPAAQLVLALASRGSVAAGAHGGIVVADREDTPRFGGTHEVLRGGTHEVLRGGTTIGFLERLAIAGSVMAGFPTALAVIIAIKGVGRFTELDAPEARERFIIGTLVSFSWACACAGIVLLAAR